MHRSISAVLAILALGIAPAMTNADPGIDVYYRDGIVRVSLQGTYAGARYLVFRAGALEGRFDPIESDQTLCTGECFSLDARAEAGATYFYRFDLEWPDGSFASYGPYAVTIPDTPLGIRLSPNPMRGGARVDLTLPGSRQAEPLSATARVLDLRGRTLRIVQSGMIYRGTTTISWDGKDGAGNRLRPGTYFLRLDSALGARTIRFVAL
jgi:hypothetical protein